MPRTRLWFPDSGYGQELPHLAPGGHGTARDSVGQPPPREREPLIQVCHKPHAQIDTEILWASLQDEVSQRRGRPTRRSQRARSEVRRGGVSDVPPMFRAHPGQRETASNGPAKRPGANRMANKSKRFSMNTPLRPAIGMQSVLRAAADAGPHVFSGGLRMGFRSRRRGQPAALRSLPHLRRRTHP